MPNTNLNVTWTDDRNFSVATIQVPHENGDFSWDDGMPAYIRCEINKLTGWILFTHNETPVDVPSGVDLVRPARLESPTVIDWNDPHTAWLVQSFALNKLTEIAWGE